MSECKHCFDLDEGKFCKRCGANFDELANDLKLTAQVAVLRVALEEINKVSTEQGLSMLDGACKVDKLACEALDATPVEASERVQKLVAALDEIKARCELRKNDDDAHFENYYEAQNAISEWRNIQ